MNNHHTRAHIFACIISALTLYHASIKATAGAGSQSSAERPSINYYGTLEDASGNKTAIEHIALGSRSTTSAIPVYGKLEGCAAYPHDKTTFLDLRDIRSFEVLPCLKDPLVAKGTTYLEIEITLSCHGSCPKPIQKKFLIESTRKLWCDELITGARRIPQELNLTAIKKITITGARATDIATLQGAPDTMLPGEREQRKNHSCSEAAKALGALEREVEKLPDAHKHTFKGLVESVQNWVGGLCSG